MNVKERLLEKIKDGSLALLTDEEIAKKLRLGKKEMLGIRNILNTLCREGELICDSRFRYGTAEQFGVLRGTLTGNERGFGFFVPDDRSLPDLFIPARAMNGALHADTVLAIPVGGRAGDEGEIVAVLERGFREIVGTFRKAGKVGYLRADEKKYCAEIFIPAGKAKNCPDGAKAVARILSYGNRSITGEIVEVLGESGEFFTEETAIIRAHGLREE